MWEPRCLISLWAFTACYRDSFTIFTLIAKCGTSFKEKQKLIVFFGLEPTRSAIVMNDKIMYEVSTFKYLGCHERKRHTGATIFVLKAIGIVSVIC
jgi:hypothetical protein